MLTAPVRSGGYGQRVSTFVAADYGLVLGTGLTSTQRRANTDAFRALQAAVNAHPWQTAGVPLITLPEGRVECELYGDYTIPDGSWAVTLNEPNNVLSNFLCQFTIPIRLRGAGGLPHDDLRMNKLASTGTGTTIDIYPKDVETFNAGGRFIGGFMDRADRTSIFGLVQDWAGFTVVGPEKYTSDNANDHWIEHFRGVKLWGVDTRGPVTTAPGVRRSRLFDIHLWGGNGFMAEPHRVNIDRCTRWDGYESNTFQVGTEHDWLSDPTYVLLDVRRSEWHNRPPNEAVRVGGGFGNPSAEAVHFYISPNLSYHFHSKDGEHNVFHPTGRFAVYENGEESGQPDLTLVEDARLLGSTLQIQSGSHPRTNPTVHRRCVWETGHTAHNSFYIKGSLTMEDCDLRGFKSSIGVGATASGSPHLLTLTDCQGDNTNAGTYFILKSNTGDDDDVLIDGGTYTMGTGLVFIYSPATAGNGGLIHIRGAAFSEGPGFASTNGPLRCASPSPGLTKWIIEGTAENPIAWNMTQSWFRCPGGVTPAFIEFRGGEYITFDGQGVAPNWCDSAVAASTITYLGATPPTLQNFTGTPTQPVAA